LDASKRRLGRAAAAVGTWSAAARDRIHRLPSRQDLKAGAARLFDRAALFLDRQGAGMSFLAAGAALGALALCIPAGGDLLARAPWTPRRVALTFDDGPHPDYTDRLLDVLRAGHAKATFFVVGSQAEGHPALIEDILREGCEVANHTYTHPNLTRLPRTALMNELDRTQSLLEQDGLTGSRFFRPPGGQFNARVLSAARRAGYRMVLWTVLPRDHERPPAEDIRRRVLAEASDGGVILMHSGVDSTLKVLPELLRELEARGYRCVTVGELLAGSRPTDPTSRWLDASSPPGRTEPPADAL
jgi:peptidoglycan/xylan/chitin deacetylase (PgdA/CDA1 family)